ncbi:NlpC/P60 family protein [Ancylobacter aquaticus]|uniref:NlpC/P60 family protein n=1 Tax=Ancylobacter aquaticus TaxID=100 RepID=A0A4R1IAP0_ANCAQ|nr:NlpC/P60 family protein [Ancylobacter aquaticus]TCK30700.1 NlpC/P60 family protein [Ancylobacter aquaticus]
MTPPIVSSPAVTLDARLTPARPDLAARHLEGVVTAERFADGVPHRVIRPTVPVRGTPDPTAALVTEALFGETVTVYETDSEGWVWGQLDADSYVGWLPAEALAPAGPAPTHKVVALRTPVFPGPSIKLPPDALLSFGSRLCMTGARERFAVTADGGFVFAAHLAPLDAFEDDFVAVAARFLGAAYLWGGRSSLGLDCSGLVQVALNACGIPCPRDTDMQETALGTPVSFSGEPIDARRGDLLYWPGHVGIVEDGATLLHATAHFMCVVREPLAEALSRIEASGTALRSVRRL